MGNLAVGAASGFLLTLREVLEMSVQGSGTALPEEGKNTEERSIRTAGKPSDSFLDLSPSSPNPAFSFWTVLRRRR